MQWNKDRETQRCEEGDVGWSFPECRVGEVNNISDSGLKVIYRIGSLRPPRYFVTGRILTYVEWYLFNTFYI